MKNVLRHTAPGVGAADEAAVAHRVPRAVLAPHVPGRIAGRGYQARPAVGELNAAQIGKQLEKVTVQRFGIGGRRRGHLANGTTENKASSIRRWPAAVTPVSIDEQYATGAADVTYFVLGQLLGRRGNRRQPQGTLSQPRMDVAGVPAGREQDIARGRITTVRKHTETAFVAPQADDLGTLAHDDAQAERREPFDHPGRVDVVRVAQDQRTGEALGNAAARLFLEGVAGQREVPGLVESVACLDGRGQRLEIASVGRQQDDALGEIAVDGGVVRMAVADGVVVTHGGEPVSDIELPVDTSGEFVMLEHGSIAWSAIERGGRLAIRVRDFEHPWLQSFGPIPYFDIDPGYRVDATFHPYAEPRQITVDTVIEGLTQYPVAPGTVTFEIDGVEYELEPTLADDSLFFVFGDQTNRGETYGAGRYMYVEMPGEDGRVVLDFNKSYNPPCAFNDFSTCPVASPRNRLPIRVEAGEKYDDALHFSPGD